MRRSPRHKRFIFCHFDQPTENVKSIGAGWSWLARMWFRVDYLLVIISSFEIRGLIGIQLSKFKYQLTSFSGYISVVLFSEYTICVCTQVCLTKCLT